MGFWTYILRCSDGSYYTGHTDDLERRIAQHHAGTFLGYTHDRRPLEFLWADEFPTREEALASERRIKTWSRAKKEALIARDWDRLSYLAIPPGEREQRVSAPLDPVPRLRSGRTEKGEEKPVIVLVRPQLGENIGKAAAGADAVLAGAQVFDTLAEAVADCAHVYATTVRKRGVTKPVLTPEEAARAIHRDVGRSAIVFGPERAGLETEDVALARAIVTVPINPEFGSLNLAQAVILCAYEWSKHVPSGVEGGAALAQPTAEDLLPPAPQDELEGLIGHIETMLDAREYFFPPSRAVATRLTLRNLLTKPGWNHLEVRTLRGVLSQLERPAGKRR